MNDRGANKPPVWQTHLDVQSSEDAQYHGYLNSRLRDLFVHPPRLMLDIGCASGLFGAFAKEKYPDARVVGIEVNRAAAASARDRLDYVLEGKIEDVDFASAGITASSIDTVIAADVLEHMYDPWHVMVELKKYLTSDAQFIASIPNIRHLLLLSELVNNGAWTYVDAGLLDITHIRFFTQREVIRFFHETGYQVKSINRYIGRDLEAFYNENVNKPNITVKLGRMVIENLSKEEFAEFCCRQLFVVAAPLP